MTSSLPLPILLATPASASKPPVTADRNASTQKKGPSFSDILAQQRPASQKNNDAQQTAASDKAKPLVDNGNAQNAQEPVTVTSKEESKPQQPVQSDDENVAATDEAAMQALVAAQAAVVQVPTTPAVPVLSEQALEVATQAAVQQLVKDAPVTAPLLSANVAANLSASLIGSDANKETPDTNDVVTEGELFAGLAESKLAKAATAPTLEQSKPAHLAAAPTLDVAQRPAPSLNVPGHTRYVPPSTGSLSALEHAEPKLPDNPLLSSATPPANTAIPVPENAAALAAAVLSAAAATTPRDAINPIRMAVPGDSIPVMLQVSSPVGAAHWGTDLGQQLITLGNYAQQGRQTAELRLDPPDLGPLRVSITINDGIASAAFVSAHAAVRQAIETALPQLQQALAQAGISLGQTSVGDQSAQQGFAEQFSNGSSGSRGNNQAMQGDANAHQATLVSAPIPTRTPSNGLVDTFA